MELLVFSWQQLRGDWSECGVSRGEMFSIWLLIHLCISPLLHSECFPIGKCGSASVINHEPKLRPPASLTGVSTNAFLCCVGGSSAFTEVSRETNAFDFINRSVFSPEVRKQYH